MSSDEPIIEIIRKMLQKQSGSVYFPDPKRIQEVSEACEQLRKAFTELDDTVQIRIEQNPLTKSGLMMIVKGYALEIDDIATFIKGIAPASNLSVDAHTDGTVEFGIMFYGLYKNIGKM